MLVSTEDSLFVVVSAPSSIPNNTTISPVDDVLFLKTHPSFPSAVFIFAQSFRISVISTSTSLFTSSNSIELINGIIF